MSGQVGTRTQNKNPQKPQLQQLHFWAKVALVTFSNLLIAFAMALMHYSNVGADPITVLIGGIANTFKLREGTAATVMSGAFFLFALAFNRSQIKGATLVSVCTLGPFMNGSLALISRVLPHDLPVAIRLLESTLGACILGVFIGFYLSLQFGASPTDSVMLWFHKVLHLNYQYCTWIFYAISLTVGVMMGGVLGAGTIISLVLVGICSNFILKRLQG